MGYKSKFGNSHHDSGLFGYSSYGGGHSYTPFNFGFLFGFGGYPWFCPPRPGRIIEGSGRDDTLIGTSRNDEIYGRGGDDLILGLAGDDYIEGNGGDDDIFGGSGDDEINGGSGDDDIDGGSGDDDIRGGSGNDEIDGDEGDDVIRGGAGNDEIEGGNGKDELRGGTGNDDIDGGNGSDLLLGGDGDDNLEGGKGDDDLRGGAGNDMLSGGKGDDELRGGDGNDMLSGGKGDDELRGGDGDDMMMGGRGNDEHFGGAGKDTVMFSGNYADYIVDTDLGIVVDTRSGFPDGVDSYRDVEFLKFADQTIALPAFTLELLHFADQEAAAAAIQDAPNLSAVLNALRAQDIGNDGEADNTLTLSSGDAFIPGIFFGASEAAFGSGGIADIQIQNELGVQAIALGNHEFDFGPDTLAALIDGSAPGSILGADFAGAMFPYLSTNLDFSTEPSLAPLEVAGGGTPMANTVTSSVVIDVNGENIGVVGATTPTLDRISSPGTIGIEPTPFDTNPTPEQIDALAAEIQAEVDALLAANPDMNKVILLAHMQQITIEFDLATRLENVDIIVAGGSNTRLFDDNDYIRPGDSDQGQYPQFFTNAGGTTTAVVNTDGSYKYVGRLVIDFDADGNILADSYNEDVSGTYATDDAGVTALGAAGLVDPEIQQIVDAIETEIIATESNVFGVSDVFLNGNRSGIDDATDPDGVRTQETNLGNLTADANLAAAQAVDASVVVSIKNGGGIRASIGQTVVPPGGTEFERLPNEEIVDGMGNIVKPEGGISQNDIATTLAFNNGLSLLTLTKAELVAVLEHGISSVPGVAGSFPQVSGVKFAYDADLPAGSRILSAGIFDDSDNLVAKLVEGGSIVGDPAETFRIVTLNFLAGGGDGYPFPLGPSANRVDLYDLDDDGVDDGLLTGDATFAFDGTEQDALAEYLDDNHGDAASAYDEADVGRDEDARIQNLDWRSDTVFDGVSTPLVINELRIDQDSTDNDEFFELFGDANASLDGLSYVVIGDGAGGSGVVESVTDLTGLSLDANGYFVAAEGTFTLGTADATVTLNFENSDNVTHMLVRDFAGSNGDDLDTDDDGTLDATPWSEIVDSLALIETPGSGDLVYSTTQLGPDGSFVPGHAFRSPDGGAWQIGAFDPLGTDDTPGATNPVVMPPLDLAIYDIQGAGHRSSHEGDAVRTTGIVTAIGGGGYYLQDAAGDADNATSDGIFIVGDATGIAVGDEVEVEGSVEELQFGSDLSVTRIVATSATVNSTGNALPAATVVSNAAGIGIDRVIPDSVIDDDGLTSFDPATDAIDFFESLEGMLVEVDNPLVIAGTSRFDEVGLAAGRGGESGTGNPIKNAVVSSGDFNPEILLTDDILSTEPDATTGDTFAANPIGVMDYTFGAYKLQLTSTPTVVSGGRTQDVSTLVGDGTHMTVATVNAFNLDPSDTVQAANLASIIVNNMNAPDIIALQEIQDNTGPTNDGVTDASATLNMLIAALGAAGATNYAFGSLAPVDLADGGQPGANIQNAFLYDTTRVSLDSITRIVDDAFEANGDGTPAEMDYAGTRKPLVGEFTFLPTSDTVTVIGNHLKSKSQDDGLFGESQPPVQTTLDQRVDQAEIINAYVEGILSGDADANVIVLGDMNDFQFSDTLAAMADGGDATTELTNLIDSLPTEDQYSFIFNGNSQVLDHILVSDNIDSNGADVDIVHVNLDFGMPGDASDHDPVLARVDLSDSMMV